MDLDVFDRGARGTGKPRVLSEQCVTCIFRPGNLMNLREGRLQQIVRDTCAAGSYIVCHETLPGMPGEDTPALCRGFYDRYGTNFIRVMDRLGGFVEIPPPPSRPVVRRHAGSRKPRRGHAVDVCVRCHEEAPIAGRGLCDACWAWAKAHECLEDYPYQRRGLPLSDVVEEYELLRSAGNSDAVIAGRLHMKLDTLRARLKDARAQGLLPQAVSR